MTSSKLLKKKKNINIKNSPEKNVVYIFLNNRYGA